MAFHDAVLDPDLIADIHVVQDDGIPDDRAFPDESLLENDGIFHGAVDDRAACDEGILHRGARVILRGREVIGLRQHGLVLSKERIADVPAQEVQIRLIIRFRRGNAAPVAFQMIGEDPLHAAVADDYHLP